MTRHSRPRTPGRLTGDDGATTSLSIALVVPVFCVLATMAVQAASWGHARTEARVAARETAVLVARRDLDATAAVGALRQVIGARSGIADITDLTVEVVEDTSTVSVRVWGRVPGLVHGLSAPIDVVEMMPREGWRR